MAKQTWDTSRTGGGTYEFTQDAQGNYTLGSVGFQKLNKLNLPELKKEAVTTDTTKAAATVSAQTKQAFGDVQPFYYDKKGEGGTGTQYTMRKEGDLSTETKPMTTGDGPWTMRSGAAEIPGMLGDTGGSIKRDTTPEWAKGVDKRGYENIGKEVRSLDQVGRTNAGQILAERKAAADQNRFGPGQWGPQPSNIYRSETEKFKTRFDPTQIKAAPQKANVVTTQLKKVNTALSPLAKAVGFVMNPIKGLVGAATGMVKDSPTDKFNRQYFNTVGNTSRIAGNPATDLYAGMNQTSAFGNTERAGAKRIATREKTIAKKGYKAGDKFFDDTQKMKGQQKDYKDSKDNNVVDKGFTRTKAERKANPGRQFTGAEAGGGPGGGNGGGRVICTELHRTHELSTKDWIRDVHFTFNTLTENHIKGYLIWAIPTVKHMKKYP